MLANVTAISPAQYREVQRAWGAAWAATTLTACLPDGTATHGRWPTGFAPATAAKAITEALRWGEPAVVEASGRFCWAVPLTHNASVTGGLVALIGEQSLFPHGLDAPAFDMRAACTALRVLAESANLTNAALLERTREHHERERQRAAFLHALKRGGLEGLAATYLREEAALLAAVRLGERGQARAILNRMLTGIYHQAAGSVERAKALLLELVVLLMRTAVEAGGRRDVLLGGGIDLLALSGIRDEEELARWLRRTCEAIFDSLESLNRRDPEEELFQRCLRWINEHCDEDLGRDAVAAAVGVSPPRLTRLIKTHAGRGFSDLLNRARIDRAKELLDHGRSALDVSIGVGFADASYFTKVFRRLTGMTPSAYRARSG
jgi:AraC-like DNA-binding protein